MATGRLTSWALYAAVTYVAPASRVVVPSSNTVITSSSHRTQLPIVLDFTSEAGRAAAHQWYKQQGSKTRFTSLEYRKDREGQFRHEFIVVRLNDTTLCRFDRRAREDLRGYALKDEGTITEDSAHVLYSDQKEYEELDEESEVLLSISFPDGEDLKLILAVCYGIQAHPRAASYSLFRYNCFFFSWTVVTAVARPAVKWEDALTSGIVWKRVREMINGHTHTHIVPSHPIHTRAGGWSTDLTRRYTSIFSVNGQDIKDLWGPFEYYLISEGQSWDLGPILQRVLLRSQLNAALTKAARRFVKAIWLGVLCSHAKGNIRRLVPSEPGRELSHYTLEEHKYVEEIAMRICRTAAETMLKHDEKRGNNNEPGRFFPPGDGAWDYAGREHYMHLKFLSLYRSAIGAKSSGPSLTAQQFGIEVEKIGERILRETKEKYARLAFEQSTVLARHVTAALLENLVAIDIDPKRLTFGESAKKHTMYVSEHPPLHEYIGYRMQDHFKVVESFGFGNFEELLTTAEESMCEIWVTTTNVLDRNISSWPLNPPRREDLGSLVPPWLLGLGLRIRPVLRPIIIFARVVPSVPARVVKAVLRIIHLLDSMSLKEFERRLDRLDDVAVLKAIHLREIAEVLMVIHICGRLHVLIRIAEIALILAAVIVLIHVPVPVPVPAHVPVPSFALTLLLAISTLYIIAFILILPVALMILVAFNREDLALPPRTTISLTAVIAKFSIIDLFKFIIDHFKFTITLFKLILLCFVGLIYLIVEISKHGLIHVLGPARVLGCACILEIVLRMVIVPYLSRLSLISVVDLIWYSCNMLSTFIYLSLRYILIFIHFFYEFVDIRWRMVPIIRHNHI